MKKMLGGWILLFFIIIPFSVSFAQDFESKIEDIIIIDRDIILSKPTQFIGRQKIVFQPHGRIVTNGFDIRIEAPLIEIKSEPLTGNIPTLISFLDRPGRAPGDHGRSAKPIYIISENVLGDNISIDNFGEDGIKGSQGVKGSPGSQGQQGTQMQWSPWQGCYGGTNGHQGGQGGTGGQGTPGGNAGNGGDVIIFVKNGSEHFMIKSVLCGKFGEGGDKGKGGDCGPGGPAAPGTTTCGGTGPGPLGPEGPEGPKGIDGEKGMDGHFHIINRAQDSIRVLKIIKRM